MVPALVVSTSLKQDRDRLPAVGISECSTSESSSAILRSHPSIPILSQVGYLGTGYVQWMHHPVGGAPRFFRSSLLEAITKTPWWVVPCIWVPITLALLARALSTWSDQPAAACSLILAGLILWQLIEYCLHRFIFHAEPTEYWGITFHFLFHGCHHKYPTDAMRLVFPPLPAGAIAGGIWGSLRIALSQEVALPVFAGIIGGYLAYDCLHYLLHHDRRKCSRLGWLSALRDAHLHHHYCEQGAGYGISSRLFDFAFATVHA